jgi:hypothetical protein
MNWRENWPKTPVPASHHSVSQMVNGYLAAYRRPENNRYHNNGFSYNFLDLNGQN